jgi:hypothetical protein
VYESPYTNVVVAASVPSGENRARLGSPDSGRSRTGLKDGPSSCDLYVVTAVRRAARQIASPGRAYSRSHGVPVNARGPSGSDSGTSAASPYPWPSAVLRNTRCGTPVAAARLIVGTPGACAAWVVCLCRA